MAEALKRISPRVALHLMQEAEDERSPWAEHLSGLQHVLSDRRTAHALMVDGLPIAVIYRSDEATRGCWGAWRSNTGVYGETRSQVVICILDRIQRGDI